MLTHTYVTVWVCHCLSLPQLPAKGDTSTAEIHLLIALESRSPRSTLLAGLVSTEASLFGLKMTVFWYLHMAFPLYVYILISLYKMELRPTHRTSLPSLLLFFFFVKKILTSVYFYASWPLQVVCGILVPRPGIKPLPLAMEVHILNSWTTRETSLNYFFKDAIYNTVTFWGVMVRS